ncbi:universal stress protein [Natronobacterium gregoryi]|uniref:Universal stress protein n=2 Tax=Natronobacterium gregoryi TaxID=44930 RepID=L0AHX8_NATGS|nr:universal stress protein [Natronobacterium gregoryi]AFZ72640.1 universal stress protein UspA-like protein [Natronobacterium gregoryi SP2]ELY69072.1 UspA domain-containing protein [Natronobacterium gregoryi SP2]PLK19114.1 universal stress protein [Natronobacterium gregoryi SP2]SFI90417.1 Nucleotide-binding universal stress protein, UspA family [Natronobacterium gregoryi]
MYDRILLPTDAEKGTELATEHAIAVAAHTDAELHLLSVVDSDVYSSYTGDEYVHEFEGLEAALEQTGEHALEAVAESAREAGIEPEPVVRHGTPHEEIIDYAEEADVDLLVMGSKERSGEYRRLIGSVTDRVARLASRPVTIVKTPVEEESATVS